VARERDNTAWGANANTSGWAIASRQYLLQNWRADVVRATDSSGNITDRIRYTAYGEPQRHSLFDVGRNSGNIPDGSFDGDDFIVFINSFGIGDASVDPAADVDHDGTIDGSDFIAFTNAFAIGDEGPLGTGQLSRELDAGFRRGYAGYEFDPVLGASSASIYHVRNRVYDAENGRWNRRDPLGYVDGTGLYEYCGSEPQDALDPAGLSPLDIFDWHKYLFGGKRNRDNQWLKPLLSPGMVEHQFNGDCTARLRCNATSGPYEHCGIEVDVPGVPFPIPLDGSGGKRSWWTWSPFEPVSPGTIYGPKVTLTQYQCKCLFRKAGDWNTHDFRRKNYPNNSNWALKCLLSRCAIIDKKLFGNLKFGPTIYPAPFLTTDPFMPALVHPEGLRDNRPIGYDSSCNLSSGPPPAQAIVPPFFPLNDCPWF
jgi:RHS repeat-associated protein